MMITVISNHFYKWHSFIQCVLLWSCDWPQLSHGTDALWLTLCVPCDHCDQSEMDTVVHTGYEWKPFIYVQQSCYQLWLVTVITWYWQQPGTMICHPLYPVDIVGDRSCHSAAPWASARCDPGRMSYDVHPGWERYCSTIILLQARQELVKH